MATYKEIKGRKVQTFSSDPPAATVGQVFYNSTTATFKIRGAGGNGTWAVGGNLGSGRYAPGQWGTQTASMITGGGYPSLITTTEVYDGSSWSASPAIVTDRTYNFIAVGTTSSAMIAGGNDGPPSQAQRNDTETWNNTAWSTSPATMVPAGMNGIACAGLKTSAIGFGGGTPNTTAGMVWNDTSWAATNSLTGTARRELGGVGTKTAALAIGGKVDPPFLNIIEVWDDTCWATNPATLLAARYGAATFGTTTSAVVSGGYGPGLLNTTELWNGTSMSAGTAYPAPVATAPGCGTSALGLVAGGEGPPGTDSNITNAWNDPLVTTITQS